MRVTEIYFGHSVNYIITFFIFTSLYPCMIQKVFILGQFFEMQILMDLHVLKSPESENDIFSRWSLSLCVYLFSAQLQNKLK